ncbi:MAG: hypothetical protein DRN81_04440 [Thermoproteota archaeon]|nr:MAG: hypothetical protein DRN81_04440 [Candidatus Korarchaeota archaeon]
MKRCFKCGAEKPLDQYYKHPAMKDGHLGKCKECTKMDARATRAGNMEYYQQYDRGRSMLPHRVQARKAHYEQTKDSPERRATAYRANRAWLARNPEKRKAYQEVAKAVKKGIVKKGGCRVCACSPVEGHHVDYNAPLDIICLCSKHHKEAHRLARANSTP